MIKVLEILPEWDVWDTESEINPFNRDSSRMGTRIGGGPIMAMYTNHSNYKDIILVNTKTGARCKITLA